MPSPLLYKDSNKESSNDTRVSDWIYRSGQINQGKAFLAYLTGKTDEDKADE